MGFAEEYPFWSEAPGPLGAAGGGCLVVDVGERKRTCCTE